MEKLYPNEIGCMGFQRTLDARQLCCTSFQASGDTIASYQQRTATAWLQQSEPSYNTFLWVVSACRLCYYAWSKLCMLQPIGSVNALTCISALLYHSNLSDFTHYSSDSSCEALSPCQNGMTSTCLALQSQPSLCIAGDKRLLPRAWPSKVCMLAPAEWHKWHSCWNLNAFTTAQPCGRGQNDIKPRIACMKQKSANQAATCTEDQHVRGMCTSFRADFRQCHDTASILQCSRATSWTW